MTTEKGVRKLHPFYNHLSHSNYTLRVMPLPLYDIGRVAKGVEEHVQVMQQYLCRNHSDERLKVEMAARHRNRLLTATQQSVSYYLPQLDVAGGHSNNITDNALVGRKTIVYHTHFSNRRRFRPYTP